jgi:hypothetical protein
MTKSLTTLIANVQALLLDDGTRFSTATVTAAVRAALKDFNQVAPIYAGELVDVVANQKEYALNTTAFEDLIDIIDVLQRGTDALYENHISVPFDAYFEDAAPFIRLRSGLASGYLVVRYSIPYTVSGLDSETASTIPPFFDDVLIDGACYWSCQIRQSGRIETINLNQGVPDELSQTKIFYYQAFMRGLGIAARRHAPVSELDTHAWNDSYHTLSHSVSGHSNENA